MKIVVVLLMLCCVGVIAQEPNGSGKAAVPPPGNGNAGGSKTSCFAANTRVITYHGIKPIGDLVIGDNILVEIASTEDVYAKGVFVPFVSWLHRSYNETATFIDIISTYGAVTLSPEHYIYVSEECDGKFVPMKAEEVEVGWCLQNPDRDSPIEYISRIEMEGYYAPFLGEDKFYVVNGDNLHNAIAVTPYAKAFPTPLQKKILSKLLFLDTLFERPDDIQGMPILVKWVLDYGYWFLGY